MCFRGGHKKEEIEAEETDTVGLLFGEVASQKVIAKPDSEIDKIVITREGHKRGPEYNSLSEIFADKVDFDMSTIKEMVESLEEDTLNFRAHAKTEISKPRVSLKLPQRDEQTQNSFEKIIKYMKKEISKIDAVKRREKDNSKVEKMMKDFIGSLKGIELSPRVMNNKEKNRTSVPSQNIIVSPEIKITKTRSYTTFSNKTAATKKKDVNNMIKLEEHSHSTDEKNYLKQPDSNIESMSKDEENITKDFAEPTPNKLPPMSTFSSKNQTPDSVADCKKQPEFHNEKVSDIFSEFVLLKNSKKQLSHTASKEELKTPENENMGKEFKPHTD